MVPRMYLSRIKECPHRTGIGDGPCRDVLERPWMKSSEIQDHKAHHGSYLQLADYRGDQRLSVCVDNEPGVYRRPTPVIEDKGLDVHHCG